MSYITSVVVLEPELKVEQAIADLQTNIVVLQPASQDGDAKWKACYLQALWRRLRSLRAAFGVYVLVDTGGGYLTSSPFVDIPKDQGEPARLRFPTEVRDDLSRVLETLLDASSVGEVLVICEPTFAPLGAIPEHRYDNYPIADLMSLSQFWFEHDSGMLLEQTIYRVYG